MSNCIYVKVTTNPVCVSKGGIRVPFGVVFVAKLVCWLNSNTSLNAYFLEGKGRRIAYHQEYLEH